MQLIAALALGVPSFARAAAALDPCPTLAGEGALPSSTCPVVFGDDDDRRANGERREDLLVGVEPEPFGWAITHRANWREPVDRSYRGLTLVEASAATDDCAAAAIFELEPEATACAPGLYAAEVDDALGEDTQILAIVDGAVLLEAGGDLATIIAEDAAEASWRMIWYPQWRLPRPYVPGPAPAARPPSRRRGRR